jgi:hypothetical protein
MHIQTCTVLLPGCHCVLKAQVRSERMEQWKSLKFETALTEQKFEALCRCFPRCRLPAWRAIDEYGEQLCTQRIAAVLDSIRLYSEQRLGVCQCRPEPVASASASSAPPAGDGCDRSPPRQPSRSPSEPWRRMVWTVGRPRRRIHPPTLPRALRRGQPAPRSSHSPLRIRGSAVRGGVEASLRGSNARPAAPGPPAAAARSSSSSSGSAAAAGSLLLPPPPPALPPPPPAAAAAVVGEGRGGGFNWASTCAGRETGEAATLGPQHPPQQHRGR